MQKEKRVLNGKHLAWVRSRPCAALSLSCNGPIQAHHLLKPWAGGRGMSLKADDRNVIPLCQYHHAELHTRHGSEKSFFNVHARSEDFAKLVAKELWDNSPFNK